MVGIWLHYGKEKSLKEKKGIQEEIGSKQAITNHLSWCRGSTSDSDSGDMGSIPIERFVFFFVVFGMWVGGWGVLVGSRGGVCLARFLGIG